MSQIMFPTSSLQSLRLSGCRCGRPWGVNYQCFLALDSHIQFQLLWHSFSSC